MVLPAVWVTAQPWMLRSMTFLPFDNLGVSAVGHEHEQPSSLHSLTNDGTDGESFTK